MPRPEDSGGPPHPRHKRMLLCCLRRTLKPSTPTIAISKLYQLFRVRDHPCGLQNDLPTLNPSCSLILSSGGVSPPICPFSRSAARFQPAWCRCPTPDRQNNSAMGPRLDTGGWLTLTESHYWFSSRQGLSPCKIRRAFLGAITFLLAKAYPNSRCYFPLYLRFWYQNEFYRARKGLATDNLPQLSDSFFLLPLRPTKISLSQ